MKTGIKNINIIEPNKIIDSGFIAFDKNAINYIGKETQKVDILIDGENNYLFAGFIDLHCHGGNGYDFMDATKEEMLKIAEFHLSYGTTTLYATTMTDRLDYIEKVLKEYSENSNALTLEGVHLEGPWFSAEQCGAQDSSMMQKPTIEEFTRLLKLYPSIKRVSAAPEIENGMEIGKFGKDSGIVMSVGHTDADFNTIEVAIQNGYNLMTHFYSGMKGVTRKNAYRIAGAVEAGYYLDNMYVEVIADGKHLPKELLKLIYKIKSAERICLITDAMRGSGLVDGHTCILGRKEQGIVSIIEDGVAKLSDRTAFAGSVATMQTLIKTMYFECDCDLIGLSKMASATPARVMGLSDRGEIVVGKKADLVITDKDLNIKKVFLNGIQTR